MLQLLGINPHSCLASPLLAPTIRAMLWLTPLNPHHPACTVPQIVDHKDDSQPVAEIDGEFNTTSIEVRVLLSERHQQEACNFHLTFGREQ